MKKNKEKISSTANLIKAAVAILFAISLGVAVNVLHTGEEDTTTTAFATQLGTFKRHVVSSHWQWRVRQPTTMIMLIHYDEKGNEVNRKPVRMNHEGWPTADLSDPGCEKIWKSLVASPLRVDGFKVHARYYAELDEGEDNYWCRYSLSRGAHFDYYPATGSVTNLNE
ncbi:hypothetical protein [Alteromonas mediterranea]|uniref:hypothetical protein n=1 Tax=Alteromonas mediterranea TaxID=314275 RepID=UPI00241EF9DD|nr:hypothetical protein [Alteromonas mediterranea]MBR9895395.1 hypothetical protein [Gammaproteobacteria bacterium]